ncbi:MAG: glycosyltransferase [Pseudomonadota bacterium]
MTPGSSNSPAPTEATHYKIYTSDEGFGHLVRQRAIHDQLRLLCPQLQTTLQTKTHMQAAKLIFEEVSFIEKFNNIKWAKTASGTPDLEAIARDYADYLERSDAYIASETDIDKHTFVISDFVYEAFEIANAKNVPAFGVAHHTWDWFFSKLYPLPVRTRVLRRLHEQARSAQKLYFPPLTPPDILNAYKENCQEVPFIVRDRAEASPTSTAHEFKVLILDSGSRLLSTSIRRALEQLHELDHIHFFVPEYFGIQADNVTLIGDDEVLMDYMPEMNLVICRAGFNTISECIAHRTPLLLVSEALNPEMESNMLLMKQHGLASFVSLNKLAENFGPTLLDFLSGEYDLVKRHMAHHDFRTDGARVVAEDILNRVMG